MHKPALTIVTRNIALQKRLGLYLEWVSASEKMLKPSEGLQVQCTSENCSKPLKPSVIIKCSLLTNRTIFVLQFAINKHNFISLWKHLKFTRAYWFPTALENMNCFEGHELALRNYSGTRYNEPLYNEVSRRYNERYSSARPAKVTVKCMEHNPYITNPRYNEHILPVPWHFVISGFHCIA